MAENVGTPLALAAEITDRNWVRQSFMLSRQRVQRSVQMWQMYCSADSKFTSSRLGNNFVINPPPQYTPYADIRHRGIRQEKTTGESMETGMGHYYSDQLDDNMVQISMRFGVAEYNGMVSFFTGFYDNAAANMANRGLIDSALYNVGKLIGVVLTIRFWPLMVLNAIGNVARFATGSPASKYYYLEPKMYLYWSRVNFIANTLGVQMGLVPRVERPFMAEGEAPASRETDRQLIAFFRALDPDLWSESGDINIFAMATKAQRMANQRYLKMDERLKAQQDALGVYTELRRFAMDYRIAAMQSNPGEQYNAADYQVPDPGNITLVGYLEKFYGEGWGDVKRRGRKEELAKSLLKEDAATVPATSETQAAATPTDQRAADLDKARENMRGTWNWDYINGLGKDEKPDMNKAEIKNGWLKQVTEGFRAEYMDGSQFLGLRVDNPGTGSESFSNSTRQSDIAGKINGIVNSARSARFTFSDGNLGGAVGDVVSGITSAVGSLVSGVLDGVHMSGLLSLAGSAFVDIPEVYDSSSSTMPSSSYSIQLRSPYGNKMSRFINLYVPLSCLLAAALPMSTGKQSYTGPFLCELYSRGRNTIRLGIITSMSITRGVGTLGWNNDDEPLGIDINFEVKDLSSIMHAPIIDNIDSVLPWKGLIDDDSVFGDYMGILSSLSLEDQAYPMNKLLINLTKKGQTYRKFASGPQVASYLGNKFPGRILASFAANPEVSINR